MPPILWVLWFLCIAMLGDGLGWGPTLWVGMLTTSAGLGFMLSLTTSRPPGRRRRRSAEPVAGAARSASAQSLDPGQTPPLALPRVLA